MRIEGRSWTRLWANAVLGFLAATTAQAAGLGIFEQVTKAMAMEIGIAA